MEMMRAGKISAKRRHARLTGGTCCAAGDRHNEPGQTKTNSLPVTNHLHPGRI
jgi:hypothetical protein